MQAPTTEGGLAGKDPRGSTCPNCGAENPVAAQFCWRCYRPFAQPEPQASQAGPQPAHWPPPPIQPNPFTVPEPPRSRIGALVAIAAVTVAVIGAVVLVVMREPAIETPEAFGELTKIASGPTDAAIDQFHAMAEDRGLDADMAFYADGATPRAALIWIRDASVPSTDAAFDAFAAGFTEGFGAGGLDTSHKKTETVGETLYVCAPVTGQVRGSLCMWEDGEEVFWILFDVQPGARLVETQTLAVSAHDAAA